MKGARIRVRKLGRGRAVRTLLEVLDGAEVPRSCCALGGGVGREVQRALHRRPRLPAALRGEGAPAVRTVEACLVRVRVRVTVGFGLRGLDKGQGFEG